MEKNTNSENEYEKAAKQIGDSTPTSDTYLLKRQAWEENVKGLYKYTKEHPEQVNVISYIDNLIRMDYRWETERINHGTSDLIKKWEEEMFPEQIYLIRKEIVRLKMANEQIDIILRLLFLSNQEFFEVRGQTYSQEDMDKKYIETLNGDDSIFKQIGDLLKGKENGYVL